MKIINPIPINLLNQLAATIPAPEPVAKSVTDHPHQRIFDLDTWLSKFGIEVQRKDNYEDGYRYILKECPFNPVHTGTSTAIFQRSNGALGFKCQHNECAGRDWADLRELKEPGFKNRNNGNGHKKDIDDTTITYKRFNRTDLGNAERLMSLFGTEILYCYDRKLWLIWNKNHWQWDFGGQIMRYAQKTVRTIYEEASREEDDDERKKLADWAKNSESNMRLNAMVAQSEPLAKISLDKLDTNNWLFNCQNCTIDLRTGKTYLHKKDDYLTMISPIEYNPNAKCEIWTQFLSRICNGNQNLITYLQRCMGYSLTGDTTEQCLFFAHGSGMNGKSTFLNVFMDILAPYAAQADVEMFLTSFKPSKTGHTEDIANLAGKRLVVASEFEEGRRLAVPKLKQMTGGERVRASHKYEREFEYEVTYKIWLNANHRPDITDTTYSIWRRIKLIPFTITIPKEEQDHKLKQKLRAEYPAILAWAVAGCLDWQDKGLNDPLEVMMATDSYRLEQDVLGDFIKAKCVLEAHNAECTASHKNLYTSYQLWCGENSIDSMSSRTFAKKLKEKDYIQKFTSCGQIKWRYIRLSNPEQDAPNITEQAEQNEMNLGDERNDSNERNDEPNF